MIVKIIWEREIDSVPIRLIYITPENNDAVERILLEESREQDSMGARIWRPSALDTDIVAAIALDVPSTKERQDIGNGLLKNRAARQQLMGMFNRE